MWGERVFLTTGLEDRREPRLLCYDARDGRVLWFCSSPVLHKDLIIFNGDQDAEAWIVALDRATGEVRWRADRPNRVRSYTLPVVLEAAGRRQLVLSGSKGVASYDPDTGRLGWIVDDPTDQMAASLVQADGVIFVTGGYPELHLLGIRPGGEGNVTKRNARGEDVRASPALSRGRIYVRTLKHLWCLGEGGR